MKVQNFDFLILAALYVLFLFSIMENTMTSDQDGDSAPPPDFSQSPNQANGPSDVASSQ